MKLENCLPFLFACRNTKKKEQTLPPPASTTSKAPQKAPQAASEATKQDVTQAAAYLPPGAPTAHMTPEYQSSQVRGKTPGSIPWDHTPAGVPPSSSIADNSFASSWAKTPPRQTPQTTSHSLVHTPHPAGLRTTQSAQQVSKIPTPLAPTAAPHSA